MRPPREFTIVQAKLTERVFRLRSEAGSFAPSSFPANRGLSDYLKVTLRVPGDRSLPRVFPLNKDIAWLRETLRRAGDKCRDEIASLRKHFGRRLAAAKRLVGGREGTIAWLRERNARMRVAVARATELIASVREKNAWLRAEVRNLKDENAALASRIETLQAQIDKLYSTRNVLSKALYGSKSERQKKPGTGRKRGQQRGAAGHGRTQHPGLGKKKERREPPEDARVCPRCGKSYVANGERCTTLTCGTNQVFDLVVAVDVGLGALAPIGQEPLRRDLVARIDRVNVAGELTDFRQAARPPFLLDAFRLAGPLERQRGGDERGIALRQKRDEMEQEPARHHELGPQGAAEGEIVFTQGPKACHFAPPGHAGAKGRRASRSTLA